MWIGVIRKNEVSAIRIGQCDQKKFESVSFGRYLFGERFMSLYSVDKNSCMIIGPVMDYTCLICSVCGSGSNEALLCKTLGALASYPA